ncbi:MAG: inorganic diphosphatase [Candidatus Aenigmatarchaeota archaeon]
MNLFHDLSIGEKTPEVVNIVIENTKGSLNKVEYDKKDEVFKIDRVIHSDKYHWPFDYGFLPRTWNSDEDPLDAVVLVTYPTFPGCVVEARPVALLVMEDEKGMDDKIITVPVNDPRFSKIKDLDDLDDKTIREINEFFENYKKSEPGKFVKIKEWKNAEEAKNIIKLAMKHYEKKFGR